LSNFAAESSCPSTGTIGGLRTDLYSANGVAFSVLPAAAGAGGISAWNRFLTMLRFSTGIV